MEFRVGGGGAEPTTKDYLAPRIRVVNVTKKFKRGGDAGSVIPVDNVSLEVGSDELLVLLGPSGCGKTTLLRCVAGLEQPDEGEIYINDQLVFSAEKRVFLPPNKRPISMIFQSYALWPHMTLFENVAYPLRARRHPSKEIPERVNTVLEMVGLGGLGGQYPGQISGGQQQRVALARAIVYGSGVVLFDEPLSNVDAKVRELLRIQLLDMQRELKFSAMYVTHDQTEAMALADRIAVLDNGKVAQLGAPAEVYGFPTSRYVGTFIGSANVWEGTVADVSPERALVETAMGSLEVDPHPQLGMGQEVPPKGSEVVVLARPEQMDLSVGPPPRDPPNSWECKVVTKLLLGSHTEFVIETGGGHRVRVWSAEKQPIEEGQQAWLSVRPAALRVVPAGHDGLTI